MVVLLILLIMLFSYVVLCIDYKKLVALACLCTCFGGLPTHCKADQFEWEHGNALDLINFLKTYDEITFHTDNAPSSWINSQDINALLKLVDSEEPCSHIAYLASAHAALRRSTVGIQAAFLLKGIKESHYPPTHTGLGGLNKDEILKWAKGAMRESR